MKMLGLNVYPQYSSFYDPRGDGYYRVYSTALHFSKYHGVSHSDLYSSTLCIQIMRGNKSRYFKNHHFQYCINIPDYNGDDVSLTVEAYVYQDVL